MRVDGHPRLGVCLDSCHWWASGVDVAEPRRPRRRRWPRWSEQIGLERLRVLHVNDSQTPLGSNRDRHELVGKGLIGDGLATFLGHPAFQSLPAIMETWEDKGREPKTSNACARFAAKGAAAGNEARRRSTSTTSAAAASGGLQGSSRSESAERIPILRKAQSATSANTRKVARSRGSS